MADIVKATPAQINIKALKSLISNDKLKERVAQMLGRESSIFLQSVLELYTDGDYLVKCDPNAVMAECMKAASLKLPLSKGLGFCYVIPYGNKPQFQISYRGIIQLAQRSGQYRYINAGAVCEGEIVKYSRVTGELSITGEATSDKAVGYFAYFELLNGFSKSIYWTKEQCEAHAKKFSKAWSKPDSPWHTNFDAMAIKTVLKQIISRYGIMSIEFAGQFAQAVQMDDAEDRIEAEVAAEANAEAIVMPEDDAAQQTVIQATDEEAGF